MVFAVAFVNPLLPSDTLFEVLFKALVTCALLAGIYVASQLRHIRAVMFTLVALSLVLNWTGLAVDEAVELSIVVRLAFFGLLMGIVFLDVLYGSTNTIAERLFGAAAVYVLMSFFWSEVYVLVQTVQTGAFTVALDRQTAGYFSLVTQTTLGYGDISPVSSQARTLAAMQSTLAVLYIAITIARLASLQEAPDARRPHDS